MKYIFLILFSSMCFAQPKLQALPSPTTFHYWGVLYQADMDSLVTGIIQNKYIATIDSSESIFMWRVYVFGDLHMEIIKYCADGSPYLIRCVSKDYVWWK